MAGGSDGIRQWLLEQWMEKFAQAIDSLTGVPGKLQGSDTTRAAEKVDFWWKQEFSISAGATIWLGASEGDRSKIGSSILQAAGVESLDPEDVRSTFQELVQQAFGGVAQSITARLQREVTTSGGAAETSPSIQGTWHRVQVISSAGQQIIVLVISSELADRIDPNKPELSPARSGERPPAAPEEPKTGSKPLELLLDVELPVSVSFGRAQLALRDVIKLTTGSIVELNRAVSEPVEIIVNNCVIARGQVVVVEGYFGVRIQQVISRQERIRTLK